MKAFVALVTTRADGRKVYSIGRRSRYIRFPVPRLLKELSSAEESKGVVAPWGGADTIGGSNREKASGLDFDEIRRIVERVLIRPS